MSADGSRLLPDADADELIGKTPVERMGLRAAAAAPGLLVVLAMGTLAGFVALAGTLLVYDAWGGLGPLASVDDSVLTGFYRVGAYVPAVAFAVATWRRGVPGAVVALVGVMVLGTFLWTLTPWTSVDPTVRDEGRVWVTLGLLEIIILSFVIVAPTTYVLRWIWRRVLEFRRRSVPPPGRGR